MEQNVSYHETVTLQAFNVVSYDMRLSDAIHRKLFNNDMQYLIECSEKIVRDNPKS